MKIKETISGLLKSSMILMATLFSLQTMAEPPVTEDDVDDQEQVDTKKPVAEDNMILQHKRNRGNRGARGQRGQSGQRGCN